MNFKNKKIISSLAALMFLLLCALPAAAEHFVVVLDEGSGGLSAKGASGVTTSLKSSGVSIKNTELLPYLGVALVDTDDPDAISKLSNTAGVKSVFIPTPVKAYAVVNDPLAPRQWHLSMLGAASAWDITMGSAGVVVAVLDGGIDYNHEDLKNSLWTDAGGSYGYNAISPDRPPLDDNRHGTHVSGIIAAEADNTLGIAGIAPRVKIMTVKVLNDKGKSVGASLYKGLEYVLSQKAAGVNIRIMNLSLGGEPGEAMANEEYDIFKKIYNNNILAFFAAGNEANDNDIKPTYPASFGTGLAVGAYASDGEQPAVWGSLGSNWGDKTVDLYAPGKGILSTVPANGYEGDAAPTIRSGTSMATPAAAATAALIASVNPSLNAYDIKRVIKDNLQPNKSLRNIAGILTAAQAKITGGVLPEQPLPVPIPTPIPDPGSNTPVHSNSSGCSAGWGAALLLVIPALVILKFKKN